MKYLKLFNESNQVEPEDYYRSALHYFNNNLNNDRALEYIDKAIELLEKGDKRIHPDYYSLRQMIIDRGAEPKFDSEEEQFLALQDLCDARLIYLIEEGYIVRVSRSKPDCYFIGIVKEGFTEDKTRYPFTWLDVKDYLIPFFQDLLKDFELENSPKGGNKRAILFNNTVERSTSVSESNKPVDVEDILQDNIEDDRSINAIFVYVKAEYFIL